ncbi:hypothetical protein C8_26 [Cannes 8 virus]|uniref:Peptidase S74 domain-containing protein n=1 Tax=Marseillevirus marseillevirus TaxID=694581 RepID=D2XA41_GBMV|nr:hypothetical protein MAR_ORF025 [Marseillevirus marseillevirus]ADB03818.1 hypothetical protein MAR_ORF025 [Marseillevirus marseillevirus]AGV01375.1 hypothetical protein C8_26 [Cannes 8 virus]
MNNNLKKEYSVSKGLFVPVYPNISSAPETVIGGLAYDNSTQGLLVSDGITWYSPSSGTASPTTRGVVFGTTSSVDPSLTGLGNNCGTSAGENVFIGFNAGRFVTAQTGVTLFGRSTGGAVIAANIGSNTTLVGSQAGLTGDISSVVGIGGRCYALAVSSECVSIGNDSQYSNNGSRNCSIGNAAIGAIGNTPFYNDCIVIGNNRLTSLQTCSGVIDVGSSATQWPPGDSTDVIHVGTGTDLSSNITNVVAIGSGTFAGAAVADNTFAIADDITQLRSLGLSAAASANILQFDPVTGLITQAASSRRFKEDIRELPEDFLPPLENVKVCAYEIDGKTDRGVISEDTPEIFVTYDAEGRRNGVIFARFIMALLSEIQSLKEDLVTAQRKKGVSHSR